MRGGTPTAGPCRIRDQPIAHGGARPRGHSRKRGARGCFGIDLEAAPPAPACSAPSAAFEPAARPRTWSRRARPLRRSSPPRGYPRSARRCARRPRTTTVAPPRRGRHRRDGRSGRLVDPSIWRSGTTRFNSPRAGKGAVWPRGSPEFPTPNKEVARRNGAVRRPSGKRGRESDNMRRLSVPRMSPLRLLDRLEQSHAVLVEAVLQRGQRRCKIRVPDGGACICRCRTSRPCEQMKYR